MALAGNRQNVKNAVELPETQEILSEDDSQDYNMQPLSTAPSWGKLFFVPNTQIVVDLKMKEARFGREDPGNENVDAFVFTEAFCPSKFYTRISKCHFTIEIESTSEKDEPNLSPAVLTCKGRNGLYINDDKLELDDKRILSHNDIIKLTQKFDLFRFYYQHSPQELSSLPKSCTQKYHIGTQIGSGGCGIVRLVHNLKTLQKYAMKVIRKETNPMVRQRLENNERIINEVDIMKSLSHPHVLSLTDFYETPERVIIIMDFMEGKDLLHRITQHDPTRRNLSESDAKFFFLQACYGLKYLHDKGITHRDIKPDNILLNSSSPDAIVKISDFGLSKMIADSMKTVCGTQLYVAPEVLMGGIYTNKVDIWSMGCLLFAMLSGSVPFCDAYGPPDVQTQIKEAKFAFRNRAWKNVSRSARDLIRRMLQKHPRMRPSIDDVLEHPWLKCPETMNRVKRLYPLDDTLLDDSIDAQLELTLVNVSLNETQMSAVPPPLKRRRIDNDS